MNANGHIIFGSDGQLYRKTQDGRLFRLDRYDYVLNAIVNPGAAAAPQPLNNQQLNGDGDYDFELHEIVGSRTSALLTVAMRDGNDAGKLYQNAPVNIDNWLGTAQLPHVLVPQWWRREFNKTFDFVDSSVAINTVQLVFRGYKLVPVTSIPLGTQ